MDKLTKSIESFCEDCQLWIKIENCKQCLFNVLKNARHTKNDRRS